jgi:hypothetical protein
METSDQLSFHKGFSRDSCRPAGRPGLPALIRGIVNAAAAMNMGEK